MMLLLCFIHWEQIGEPTGKSHASASTEKQYSHIGVHDFDYDANCLR
jgi:hypothetical protein